MKCAKCGSILKKDQIGVITHYIIRQDSIVLDKKEALCPVCGWCLGYKLFNKKKDFSEFSKELRGGVSNEANES